MVYASGVLGTKFNFGEPPLFNTGEPLQASFAAADSAIIFVVKQVGRDVYLYGLTTPKLIEWAEKTPRPASNEMIDHQALLTLWKLPREEIDSLKPL